MKHNTAGKRFLPLYVLVGIWLVILLVPALNLLFRVQLSGSPKTKFSALPSPELVPNFWTKAARRFPDNVNVLWQAANEYPASENPDEDESEYSGSMEETLAAPSAPFPSPPAPGTNPQPAPTPTADPTLPKSQVFPEKLEANYIDEKLRRLDLLIARFPENAALIAARLRIEFGQMQSGRVGGELSDAKSQENRAAGIPSPERTKDKPNFSIEELNRAIALARRGGKLEPDNGFFDWMQCCLLMYGWRDAQAFQALDAAGRKKRFEDYSLEEQGAQLEALSVALDRKLLVEEKLEGYFESMAVGPFGRYREMARIISWQSIKAQRRGDHQSALRIAAGLARTAARMRDNSKTYIEGLVAIAIESIAWAAPSHDTRIGNTRNINGRVSANQRIASFQDYATQHGRADLADESKRNSAASSKYRAVITANISGSMGGTPFWVYIGIALTWAIGLLLLLLFPMALLLPIVFWLLSRSARWRGVLRWRESGAEEIPSPREVWNGALACGGLRALGTAMFGAIVVGSTIAAIMIGAGQSAEVFKGVTQVWDEVVSGNGNYNGVEGIYYLLASTSSPESSWRWVIACLPLLLGVLYTAWRATEWQKKQNGETLFSFRAFVQSLFQGYVFRSPTGERDAFDIKGLVFKISDFAFMLCLIASLYWLATASNAAAIWLIPLALSLVFSGILLGEKFLIWRARPQRRQSLRYGLRLFQRSLWSWLLLGSAIYLVSLLISLPLRIRAEERVDRLLQLGEVRSYQNSPP